jgi:hypothetical protein
LELEIYKTLQPGDRLQDAANAFYRGLSPRSGTQTEIDAAGFPAHIRRMAKKAATKGRAGNPLLAEMGSGPATGAHGVTRPTKKENSLAPSDGERAGVRGRPSSLLDTRVVYCGDNLEQLAKLPDACVDLIYIDPPFNSDRNYGPCRTGQGWGLPREITPRATHPRCLRRISRGSPREIISRATIPHSLHHISRGETKEKRAFEDRHENTEAYIDYMRPRCVQLARVLKKTGSFYYHCDWHASHCVKVMRIFGENN